MQANWERPVGAQALQVSTSDMWGPQRQLAPVQVGRTAAAGSPPPPPPPAHRRPAHLPHSVQGATLVLPVVSVGNTGQLAADLLINSLRLPRAAHLSDAALLPAVGGQPYAHVHGLATALELYQDEAASSSGSTRGTVAVAQQRAPAAPGTQAAFAQRLAAFVQHAGVKQVCTRGGGVYTVRARLARRFVKT